MLNAMTAKDIEAELPSVEELKSPNYGLQVAQVPDTGHDAA